MVRAPSVARLQPRKSVACANCLWWLRAAVAAGAVDLHGVGGAQRGVGRVIDHDRQRGGRRRQGLRCARCTGGGRRAGHGQDRRRAARRGRDPGDLLQLADLGVVVDRAVDQLDRVGPRPGAVEAEGGEGGHPGAGDLDPDRPVDDAVDAAVGAGAPAPHASTQRGVEQARLVARAGRKRRRQRELAVVVDGHRLRSTGGAGELDHEQGHDPLGADEPGHAGVGVGWCGRVRLRRPGVGARPGAVGVGPRLAQVRVVEGQGAAGGRQGGDGGEAEGDEARGRAHAWR